MKRARSKLSRKRSFDHHLKAARQTTRERAWTVGVTAIIAIVLILWVVFIVKHSAPGAGSRRAAADRYEDVPGLNLQALPAEQRTSALERLNREGCTCGCKLTLAQCRNNDPTCSTSLPLARLVLVDVKKSEKALAPQAVH